MAPKDKAPGSAILADQISAQARLQPKPKAPPPLQSTAKDFATIWQTWTSQPCLHSKTDPPESNPHPLPKKARGAPVSRSAPLCSGRKPNSVPLRLLKAHRRWSFISAADRSAPAASRDAHATDTRDGPRGFPRDRAGDPASLFGLAPHGVYRAPEVAPRAVGFYPAFSPLPPHLNERAVAVSSL